jgi:YD repeat-containing protein
MSVIVADLDDGGRLYAYAYRARGRPKAQVSTNAQIALLHPFNSEAEAFAALQAAGGANVRRRGATYQTRRLRASNDEGGGDAA